MMKGGEDNLKVVFIAGEGRSGSTLLDLILGELDGFISLGEVREVWERGFTQDQLCGCGQTFSSCDFWRRVVDQLATTGGVADVATTRAAMREVDRQRNIPRILVPALQSVRFRRQLGLYRCRLQRLLSAAAVVGEGRVLIDSSKVASDALILSGIEGVDLYVIHLVRDSRAVAHSWMRQRIRPEITWARATMPIRSPLVGALTWSGSNAAALSLKVRFGKRYKLVRYEDLVRRPAATVENILHFLEEDVPPPSSLQNRMVELRGNHTISGNPMRFRVGPTRLVLDNEWAVSMAVGHRRLVTTLTLPLLLAFRYTPFRGKVGHGSD